MNIFVLDLDPKVAACYHCDKHVVKMILETAQILSTVIQNHVDTEDFLYKPTHKNHPCVLWAGKSYENLMWLYNLGISLCDEYTYRYNKVHKTRAIIERCYDYISDIFYTEIGLTKFAQAMPEQYRNEDVVKAYRNYYIGEKSNMLKYTKTEKPEWIQQ